MWVKRFLSNLIVFILILPVFGSPAKPENLDVPEGIDHRIDPAISVVAWKDYDFENAAVDYSPQHDQFLVVFERDSGYGDVYARFVDGSDGSSLGSGVFRIANSSSWTESNPDVAYDPDADRFMVVYDEGTAGNRHVWGRLVHGSYQDSGDQFASPVVHGISATGEDEFDPAVAYNSDDSQYMVVFNYSELAVHARRLESGTWRADFIGDTFEIYSRGSGLFITPDITWSDKNAERFLVVLSYFYSAESKYVIRAVYLYDMHQSGSQLDGETCWMAPYNYGSNPITNNSTNPSAAYDPHSGTFYVVFEHAEGFNKNSIYG